MKYKIIFSLVTVLLFVSCVNQTKPLQTPAWYHSQTMQVQGSTKYLGYGDAKTLEEAKSMAKEEIAQSLISHIESSFVSKTEVEKKKNQETYNTQTQHNLKVTTKIDLQNLSVLKQEYINGRYFVLLEYENLDLTYKIKKSVTEIECGDVNKYINSTPLYQTIRSSFSCDINLKLQRKNSAWYLKYKEKQFLLNSSEFEKLYVSTQSKLFDFKINKSVLQDGDSFYFLFSTEKEGYITLLNVYENGIVTLLSESQKIAKSLQIPSKESETYFEAAVVENSNDSSDLYIAFFSEKPLDMSRFAYANDELLSSEVAYKFDELIEMFNTLEYSTLIVRISK